LINGTQKKADWYLELVMFKVVKHKNKPIILPKGVNELADIMFAPETAEERVRRAIGNIERKYNALQCDEVLDLSNHP
jgi:hypothetical protein